jgi:hypothetical protein
MNWYKIAKIIDKAGNEGYPMIIACMHCPRIGTSQIANTNEDTQEESEFGRYPANHKDVAWKSPAELDTEEQQTMGEKSMHMYLDGKTWREKEESPLQVSHGVCPACVQEHYGVHLQAESRKIRKESNIDNIDEEMKRPTEVSLDTVELDTARFNLSHYDSPNFKRPQLVNLLFNTGHQLTHEEVNEFTDKYPEVLTELARKQWMRQEGPK